MYPASMLAYCSMNCSDESVKLDYRFAKKAEDHDHQWEDQYCKHIYHEMHEIHLDRHLHQLSLAGRPPASRHFSIIIIIII